jgi:hypothetical protein
MADFSTQTALSGVTLLFSRVGTPVPVPDMPSLYTSSVGPEGLLLKDIASLDEALACGGLLLVNPSGDWLFYCGDTLKQVVANNKVGQVAVQLAIEKSVTVHNAMGYRMYEETRDANGLRQSYMYRGSRFGHYNRQVDFNTYFPPGNVMAVGIVTSATKGHGANVNYSRWYKNSAGVQITNPNIMPISFMSTETDLSVPLSQFLVKAKPGYMATIPSEAAPTVGPIYDAEAAIRSSKPPVRAVTCWSGRTLSTGFPVVRPFGIVKSAATSMSYWALLMACTGNTTDIPGYSSLIASVSLGSGGSIGSGSSWQWNSDTEGGAQGAVNISTFDASNKLFHYFSVETVLGKTVPGHEYLPCISPTPECTYYNANSVLGSIGSYTGGALRDGHVLGRRLIDGLSFADSADNYASMEEYISASLPTAYPAWSKLYEIQQPSTVAAGAAQDAEAATAVSDLPKKPLARLSEYSSSALPAALDDFLDVVFKQVS